MNPEMPPHIRKLFPRGMPLYWMHEASGKMKVIVTKYLEKQQMTPREEDVIRWYVFQWVDAMPKKPAGYGKILEISINELREYVWRFSCTVME